MRRSTDYITVKILGGSTPVQKSAHSTEGTHLFKRKVPGRAEYYSSDASPISELSYGDRSVDRRECIELILGITNLYIWSV